MPRRLFAMMLAASSTFVQEEQSSAQEISAAQRRQLAQPTTQQSEARTKISVNSNLVVLSVTAKDRRGNLVPDLHREEFRIYDDNVEQSVDVFTAEAFPLSLVVLIDDDLKRRMPHRWLPLCAPSPLELVRATRPSSAVSTWLSIERKDSPAISTSYGQT